MDISTYIAPAKIIAPQAAANAMSSATGGKEAKLMDSCRQFEGQFFDMMLQEMRKTVPDDSTLGDDAHEQQIFQGMMDDNTAQEMAKHAGPNDLAAQMYKQLSAKTDAAAAPKMPTTMNAPAAAIPLIPAAKLPEILKKSPGLPDNISDHDTATDPLVITPARPAKR